MNIVIQPFTKLLEYTEIFNILQGKSFEEIFIKLTNYMIT